MSVVMKYLKAHAAALGAGLSLLIADLNTGSVTLADWYGIVGAALGVGVAVAVIPNSTPAAPAPAPVAHPAAQDVAA